MKRRLRHGAPVGNNRPTVPTPVHICSCYDCANGTCSDPLNGLPRPGRLVSTTELRRHEELARSRGIAFREVEDAFIRSSSSTTSTHQVSNPQPPTSLSPNFKSLAIRSQNRKRSSKLAIENLSASFQNLDRMIEYQPKFSLYKDIIFAIPPSVQTSPLSECSPDSLAQILDLKPDIPANVQLHSHKRELRNSLDFVLESQTKYGSLTTSLRLKAKALRRHFEKELRFVETSLHSEWERQRWVSLEASGHYVNMTPYMSRTSMGLRPYLLASYLVVLVLHLLCGLSMEHCKFVLGALNIMSGLPTSNTSDIEHTDIENTGISDIRTVEKIMMLDCSSDSFISCPKCSHLYPYKRNSARLKDSVPENCTNKLHPDSEPCSRRLWRSKNVAGVVRDLPTREFLYQSMKTWVGWMYSRADIEKLLDEDPTLRMRQTSHSHPSELRDIWDGSGLQDFKGPDGETPFYVSPGEEGRLIFSLNMDGFNPYTNKEAGKKVSTGAIYMVCLNLPVSLRYKEENIYLVGIIPGPHEPSLHEINYFLEPLVRDLLEFWDPGVFLSHTTAHPQGRWIRCAIVPLVCDLPAARQMSGSAHYTASCFCAYCWLDLEQIDDLDYKTWQPKTMGSHRKAAELWLNAPTAIQRDGIYRKFGARWSELLRLPYWDPVSFTVIDSMHAFYLRILSHHCREIWGMDSSLPDSEVRRKDTDPADKEMKEANMILRTGTLTQLKSLKMKVLRELCIAMALKSRGRKERLYGRLVTYRECNGWPRDETQQEKEESLNADAEHLFNFGSKSAFKQASKDVLLRVLRLNVDARTYKEVSKAKNAELRTAIHEARQDAGIIDQNGRLLVKKPKKPKATAVLGKETLAEIRADMTSIAIPSWFSGSPKHPGEKQWGKLTASNWRSFGLVNLPITLIRLWGNEPKSSRKWQMLDNYMHLVSAIKIATMRSIHPDNISEYQKHMHAYLTSLLTLYPNTSITPYQHLSLHFGDLLKRFGPTQAWHCFPFERYNHRMQQISKNNRFGEMEKTMFHRFRLAQLVRSFFYIPTLPTCLHQLAKLYEKTFSVDPDSMNKVKNTLLINDRDTVATSPVHMYIGDEAITWSEEELTRLSSGTFTLLKRWLSSQTGHGSVKPEIQPFVFSQPSVFRFGQKFATSINSSNNSHVLFHSSNLNMTRHRPPSRDHYLSAGRIEEIFSHTRTLANGQKKTQTFAVVAPFQKLSSTEQRGDLYRRFPAVANQAFKIGVGARVLVPIDLIISHFARVPVNITVDGASLECILAYPLNI